MVTSPVTPARSSETSIVEHTGLPTSKQRLRARESRVKAQTTERQLRCGCRVLRSPVTPSYPYVTGTAEGGQPGRLSLLSPSEAQRVHSPMAHEGLPGPRGTAVSEATARISQSPQSSGSKGQPAAAQTRRRGWPLTDRKPKKAATHTFPGTVLLEDTRAKALMGDGWWFGKERKPV